MISNVCWFIFLFRGEEVVGLEWRHLFFFFRRRVDVFANRRLNLAATPGSIHLT